MMKTNLHLLLSFLFLFANLSTHFGQNGETGLPPHKIYTPQEYGGNPGVIGIAQDHSGQLFIANHQYPSLLRFDGELWSEVEVEDRVIWNIVKGDDQKIYATSTEDVGFLATNEFDELYYESLAEGFEALDSTCIKGHTYDDILALDGIVYFMGLKHLLAYDTKQDTYKIWSCAPDKTYLRIYTTSNHFFVAEMSIDRSGGTLYKLSNGELEIVDQELLKDPENLIVGVYDLPNQNLLIATKGNGLLEFDGKTTKPFSTTADNLLFQLWQGVALSNGRYAFSSIVFGLVIVDAEGNLLYHLDNKNLLSSNNVHCLTYDESSETLWLGSRTDGLVQIDVSNHFTIFDKTINGNSFSLMEVVRHKEELFAVNSNPSSGGALLKLDAAKAGFVPLFPDFSAPGINIVSDNDQLLFASIPNVYEYEIDDLDEVSGGFGAPLRHLHQSKAYPQLYFVGTDFGLFAMHEADGTWTRQYYEQPMIPGQIIHHIVEAIPNELWLSTDNNYYKLQFEDQFPLLNPKITAYPVSDSLEGGLDINIFNGEIVIANRRYNREKDDFEKDTRFPSKVVEEEGINSFCKTEDEEGNIWAAFFFDNRDTKIGVFEPKEDGNYQWNPTPFSGVHTTQISNMVSIYPEKDGIVWLAGNDLIRVDTKSSFSNNDYSVHIRSVQLNQDSLIYGGNGSANLQSIAHKNNNIRFQFAATNFPLYGSNTYQTQLIGYDEKWSNWEEKTERNYTNLPKGNYEFLVRAKSPAGIVSQQGVYTFQILPPWYQTWWSYLLYLAILGGVGYLFYQWLKARFEWQTAQKLALQEAAQIQELDELKTRLYTNITHEFRTPLTIIMGISNTIKGHLEEKNLIQRNSKNLLQLINQMLDLSKLEVGELSVNYSQADIIPFLSYLTDSFLSMARDKEITLAFYTEEESLIMDFDEQKVQHVIYNLLSNAIKFTPYSGRVVLHVKKEENQLQIIVKDNGKGISEEQLPHIFNRFYQADAGLSRQHEGTGIGLALTKDLVKLMEGNISVKSQLEKGTEFAIQLPIKREAPNRAIQALEEKMDKQFIPVITKSSNEANAGLPIDPDKASLLVIEDNRDITNYLKLILKDTYNIQNAVDGNVGFQLATEQLPDIIISDVMLPHKNGFELCAELKKDRRTSHIPVILLTGLSTEKDRIEGLNSGADAFLTKPFNKEELMIRLENLVTLRKELQERYATQVNQVSDALEVSDTSTSNLENEFLSQLKAVVEEKMNRSDFQIADLAQGMNMSHVQVYRKLKALTGQTPSQFVRSIRLQKGKVLVLNSELTISEIAYEVGFADPSYFTRTFQKEFGKAPREFR